jgi:carbonic anhydrase
MAVALLKDGNKRFLDGNTLNRNLHQQVADTASGQYPFAAVVSCIDSRIPTEVIFDQGIGDIFNARVAGNFVNEDILGSLEFACKLAGSKVIVVMGHTSCGAVKGACDHAELGNLTQMLGKIMPAVDGTSTAEGEARNSSNGDFVNRVAVKNVELTIANLKSMSPVLNEMLKNGEIDVVGAMYDVKDGSVSFL